MALMQAVGTCISPFLLYNAYVSHSVYNLVPGQAKKLWDETHTADDRSTELEVWNWLNLQVPTIIKQAKTVM